MKLISFHTFHGGFWIRFLGVGFSILNRSICPPLFSERNGYTKALRVGKYSITWLAFTKSMKSADIRTRPDFKMLAKRYNFKGPTL